jgi:DNA-binding protein Fis
MEIETLDHDGTDVSRPHVPTLRDVEMNHITYVLGLARGNQRNAARMLGITRWALARRLKKHGLNEGLRARRVVCA